MMNTNVTLAKREKEILERVAWGASYKEVANFLKISSSTVDNTLRRVKEKIGLNKVTELSAWWFCTTYGISFSLSPLSRQVIAAVCICLFVSENLQIHHTAIVLQEKQEGREQNVVPDDLKLLSINPILFNQMRY